MRRFAFPSLLLCLLVSLVTHPARAQAVKFDYSEKTLANGLKVVVLEDHSTPVAAVQVWYHVGSKDEDPQRQGFAHMFEHMMFRGTDRLGPKAHMDILRQVDAPMAGVVLNRAESSKREGYYQYYYAEDRSSGGRNGAAVNGRANGYEGRSNGAGSSGSGRARSPQGSRRRS